MIKKLIAAAVIGAAATMTIAGAQAAEPVRIGYSISKTGLLAQAVPSQINAYELWAEQVNARGGLDVAGTRRPVEFVFYDDQSDPAQVVKIYEKLITSDKVDLLAAPYGTTNHFAVAAVLERYKFPMIGNTAASVQVRELKPKYIWFSTGSFPDVLSDDLAKMLKGQGAKTVALSNVQLPFALEFKKFLVPALKKAGLKIVVDEAYPPNVKDMTALLTNVKKAGADANISLSYPADSVLYTKQSIELGVAAPFEFVLIGPTIDFYGKIFGAATDGIVTIGHWSPHQKKWARARPFFDAYVKKFGHRPDYLDTALSYMSMEILEQAVAKAGLDREKLRQVISSTTFDTINGPTRFEGVQNAMLPAAFLQIQSGEAHIIWPPSMATSSYRPKKGWK